MAVASTWVKHNTSTMSVRKKLVAEKEHPNQIFTPEPLSRKTGNLGVETRYTSMGLPPWKQLARNVGAGVLPSGESPP